ncbi:hypothetical protein HGRIS_013975 [Hohenbuehelia grisea]|uniref:Uncharacterized protein n=1 Tax=Hohenbuehelia grisea TaxID=104357 RepID=A0ABR3JS44_9AGAR
MLPKKLGGVVDTKLKVYGRRMFELLMHSVPSQCAPCGRAADILEAARPKE